MDPAKARHELLGAPLASFVAERDRLAAALQGAGNKAAATELRKLRKPPATIWALNQVARRNPALLDELFAAGDRMAEAHQAVASSEEFRDTSAAYRHAIAAVVTAAQRVLEAAGHSAELTTGRRLERTLQALPFAPAEQQAVARRGDLEGELDTGDIFDTGRLELAPQRPAGPKPAERLAPAAAAAAAATAKAAQQEERRAHAKALRAAALNAARAAERAAKAAERAEEDLATARGRLETALRILRDAEHAHANAKDRVDQARKDLSSAEAAVADTKKAAREAAAASARAGQADSG